MMIGNYSDCGLRMIEIMFKGNTLLIIAYSEFELQHFNVPAIFRGNIKNKPDLPKYVCNSDLFTTEFLQIFFYYLNLLTIVFFEQRRGKFERKSNSTKHESGYTI